LSPEGDTTAFAANIRRLIEDTGLVAHLASGARANIGRRHSLASGAQRLDALMQAAGATHAARSGTLPS
jgi:glycosyltransferase involved in cell wall biosynthesis